MRWWQSKKKKVVISELISAVLMTGSVMLSVALQNEMRSMRPGFENIWLFFFRVIFVANQPAGNAGGMRLSSSATLVASS